MGCAEHATVSDTACDQGAGSRTGMGAVSDQALSRNVTYLLAASRHCGYDIGHWMRYLRKFIRDGKPTLTPQEVSYLAGCSGLTMCQRVVLKRAMTVGTPTYRRVRALNEPAKTPLLDQVRRKLHHGNGL